MSNDLIDLIDLNALLESALARAAARKRILQAERSVPHLYTWQETAVVLMMHIQTCQCGAHYESVSGWMREMRSGTRRWLKRISEDTASLLPHRVEEVHEHISVCPKCKRF